MLRRRTSLLTFFGLTFAFTFALQLPAVAARAGWLEAEVEALLPLAMLGVFGPLVAASWCAWREGRGAELRALYGRLLRWRASPALYALALLMPAGLLAVGLGALTSAGYEGSIWWAPALPRLLIVAPLIAVAEEVGWRGYALPRMAQRTGPFAASVVLGVIWTAWHVPMLAGVGVSLTLLPVLLLYFVGGSLFFTWIQARAGGSLLLVVLAHVGAHLNNSHLALPADSVPLLVHAVVFATIGLGLALLDRRVFTDLRRSSGIRATKLRHAGRGA